LDKNFLVDLQEVKRKGWTRYLIPVNMELFR
jgi:hypothetical protein